MHVLHLPQRVLGGQRLGFEHVERGGSDRSRAQRVDERCLVDQLSSAHVDQVRGWFHRGQYRGVDHAGGLSGEWGDGDHHVEVADIGSQVCGGPHHTEVRVVRTFSATCAGDLEAGGLQQAGGGASDPAGTDDKHRTSGGPGGVAADPPLLPLEGFRQVQLLVLGEDRAEDKLGDGSVEDPVGVGDGHVRPAHVIEQHCVDACCTDMYPPEVLCGRPVVP